MASKQDRHRVYLSFRFRDGWHCHFMEANLRTVLPRKAHFSSPQKILEMVERGGGFTDQESRLMVDQGLSMGRGGVWLGLTDSQYKKLLGTAGLR